MNIIGYLIENEYYCADCARDYCLDALAIELEEQEMLNLIPTNRLTTDYIVEMKNSRPESHSNQGILAIVDLHLQSTDSSWYSSFDFSVVSGMECSSFHELSLPHKVSAQIV